MGNVEFLLFCLTTVFFIVDPFAAVPVFLVLTERNDRQARLSVIRRAVLVATGVLIVFGLAGNLIFRLFGITLPAFRIAGGVLLVQVGLSMLQARNSRTKTTDQDREEALARDDVSITPLAVPQLAGPGAVASVMVLVSQAEGLVQHLAVHLAIVAVLFVTLFVLRWSEGILRLLGPTGLRIVTKLMGLMTIAIAVQFIIAGIGEAFHLQP